MGSLGVLDLLSPLNGRQGFNERLDTLVPAFRRRRRGACGAAGDWRDCAGRSALVALPTGTQQHHLLADRLRMAPHVTHCIDQRHPALRPRDVELLRELLQTDPRRGPLGVQALLDGGLVARRGLGLRAEKAEPPPSTFRFGHGRLHRLYKRQLQAISLGHALDMLRLDLPDSLREGRFQRRHLRCERDLGLSDLPPSDEQLGDGSIVLVEILRKGKVRQRILQRLASLAKSVRHCLGASDEPPRGRCS
mmetsp:Transcript_95084/g.268552  ORF Transcript_95084/g.268552 Transcript_95084/m.268552 type:complete len:249 (-) Transcript_95084:79-825(-)